jgi:HK97 family phage portal protein
MYLSILGYELLTRKRAGPLRPIGTTSPGRDGWYPIVREPYPGAWQANAEIRGESALSYFAVFACVTLIASDVSKLSLRLVQQDDEGIWHEATNPAYSPVLRKPNRYQTAVKFVEQWITSKLIQGNAYVLKERDGRGIVRALYVLDPQKVCPLIAPDGAVYYELRGNALAGLNGTDTITIPASEIIHDPMVPLFHPLIGVTPLYACGLSALQGLTIQQTSSQFFAGGSNPGGVLTAPGAIGDDTAARLKDYWQTNFTGANVGKVAVLGDGLKYEPMTVTAADSQLIEQLRWTAETICACYHCPAFMIGVGPPPPFASVEPMQQQYYSQCIQSLLKSFESVLDEGLDLLGTDYGTEFDVDDLIYMDTTTRTKAASEAIGSGAVSPNEARRKYFGLGSVKGGDTPYMQQQNYSLAALDERDRNEPFAPASPASPAPAPPASPAPASAAPPADPAVDTEPPEHKGIDVATLASAIRAQDWGALCHG